MASINDLPIELITRIVELTMEGRLILADFDSMTTTTRQLEPVLLRLSLISKIFTIPSQRVLWRNINIENITNASFLRVIREGFGRNKMIDRLNLSISKAEGEREEEGEVGDLIEVLQNIAGVKELNIYNDTGTILELPDIFKFKSLEGLTKLTLDGIHIDELVERLPSTLSSLTLYDIDTAESLLSRLTTASPRLEILNFDFDEYSEVTKTSSIKFLTSFFQLNGSNLTALILQNFDSLMIPLLLPFTPSLLGLVLYSSYNETQYINKSVKALPLSTRLDNLSIGKFSIDHCTPSKFLLSLVVLPQLSRLVRLNYQIDQSMYGEAYNEGDLEDLEFGDIIKLDLDLSVKICDGKGISLSFS